MADNIFAQDPAQVGNTPPPSGAAPAAAPANSSNVPPPSGAAPAAAPASKTPAKPKRSFKFPLQGILGLVLAVGLVLGVMHVALPTDSVFQSVGEWLVNVSGNSLTTLGYIIIFQMVASAVVGWFFGTRNK